MKRGRDHTDIPHITVDECGIHCERCGDVCRSNDTPGFLARGSAWMRDHVDCKPDAYVS